ncbi:serine hydrolase domain-containing protein [Rufibacter immobilis]|uniref:serine hydrolase domain-containing protein n=1 Tax=Rufibacter immobilis TaxID=1348778 RepID=UPI0035E99D21
MRQRTRVAQLAGSLLLVSLLFSSCQVGRFIYYNFANITDYKIFPSRPLTGSSTPFRFPQSSRPSVPNALTAIAPTQQAVEQFLKDNKTVAFLVIHRDSIQYERYFNGYEESSTVASFSMAKSVTSMLVGCAVEDGLIKSVEEPLTNYLPQLKQNGLENVTIRHLLQMTSGIEFNESYVNPFGHAASFYYGRNLRKSMGKLKPEVAPGTRFQYISGNTQLLGAVLEKALAGKTITTYLQEKLWGPMGMEYDASWSLDKKKDGLEKTFCCLNARARDFAKLGRLYLKQGNWNGKQLIPASWVQESTKIDTTQGSAWHYQYQWWFPTNQGDYMMQGILGQYVYVNPAKDLIIVRLGKDYGDAGWPGLFTRIAAKY